MRMQEPLSDDLLALLENVPLGQYLVERRDQQLLLWRLSDGEPPDGALEPADAWRMDCAAAKARSPPPAPLEAKPRDGVWRWCRRRWLGGHRGAGDRSGRKVRRAA
jgi:hypothetical protein